MTNSDTLFLSQRLPISYDMEKQAIIGSLGRGLFSGIRGGIGAGKSLAKLPYNIIRGGGFVRRQARGLGSGAAEYFRGAASNLPYNRVMRNVRTAYRSGIQPRTSATAQAPLRLTGYAGKGGVRAPIPDAEAAGQIPASGPSAGSATNPIGAASGMGAAAWSQPTFTGAAGRYLNEIPYPRLRRLMGLPNEAGPHSPATFEAMGRAGLKRLAVPGAYAGWMGLEAPGKMEQNRMRAWQEAHPFLSMLGKLVGAVPEAQYRNYFLPNLVQ